MGRLTGKVALITGAASKMGMTIAEKFVKQGADKVILLDKNVVALSSALHEANTIEAPKAVMFQWDGTKKSMKSLIESQCEAVNILYNHAVVEVDPTDSTRFNDAMAFNLKSLASSISLAAQGKIKEGGCILCTGSTMSLLGDVVPSLYTMSRAAVMGVIRAGAAELADKGVRVNAISSNGAATGFHKDALLQILAGADSQKREEIVDKYLTNWVTEEDVANAAVFLASDAGKSVNGHNLELNGKFTLDKIVQVGIPSSSATSDAAS
ncbi:hypothetical protein QOZ80_5BG0428860 [Eleusine coracana subsp. coracana]|nr:hypothetical protein QOZ80_5BG0428860 [Eleusine coracana subsp. coracana]